METFSVDDAVITFENGHWTCCINNETYTNAVTSHILPVNTVFLEVTTQCNLSCTYCYQKNNQFKNLEYSHAKNAIEWACNTFRNPIQVVFFGGEPFLRKKFIFRLVKEYQNSISFGLQTNGTLLKKNDIKRLSQYRVNLSISFDGLPWLHDKHRIFPGGGPSSGQVLATLKDVIKENIPVGVITVLEKGTIKNVFDILDFFIENNITKVSFIPLRDHKDALSPKEYAHILLKAAEYIKDKNIMVREIAAWASTLMVKSPLECGCGPLCPAGVYQIAVDPWGTVYGCPRLKDGNPLGEKGIPSKSFETSLHEKCKICCFFEFCRGSCPAYDSEYSCQFTKYFVPRVIAALCKDKEFIRKLLGVTQ